jgi:hypothetical protein
MNSQILTEKKYNINNNKMTSIINPITKKKITLKVLSKRLREGFYNPNEIKMIQERLKNNNLGFNSKTGRISKSTNRELQKQLKKDKKEKEIFGVELIKQFSKKEDNKRINKIVKSFNNMIMTGDNKTSFNLSNLKFYSKQEAFKKILKLLPLQLTQKILIEYVDESGLKKYYALNDMTKKRLIEDLDKNFVDAEEVMVKSNSQFIYTGIEIGDLSFILPNMIIDDDNDIINNNTQTSITNQLLGGAMFPYLLLDDGLDLKKYGVYSNVDSENYNENCLIQSLKNSGELKENQIEKIKVMLKTREIPKRKLKQIAEKLNICLCISQIDKKIEYHGDKKNKQIKLGLIENHYFIIDKETNITSYSLKNYFDTELRQKKDWKQFIKKDERNKNRFIDSFNLIKYLTENKEKFLKPIPSCNELYKTSFYDNFEIDNLNAFDEDNFKEIEYIEKDDYNGNVVYFDFETITEDKHIPYLCNCDLIESSFYGEECGKSLLNYLIRLGYKDQKITTSKGKEIQKPLTLIAHNLGYDFSFISKYLDDIDIVNKGKLIVVATGTYKGLKIRFMDSLMMIPMKLASFPKTFGLDSVKEIMPYDLYTKENLYNKNGYLSLQECFKSQHLLNEDDKKLFTENCIKWNCILEGKVNLNLYSSKYCFIDCLVLKKGYEKFRTLMRELNGLDTLNYYSIASIAQTHLIKLGCYNGVQSVSGVVREFIQKCVVGGRCMTSNNQKHIYTGKNKIKLADYDACSLYPSAMYRIEGFLLGKPKVLSQNDINNLKSNLNLFDGFFIKIKVLSVGKKYKIPCMSKVTEKGIREWSNKMENEICYVDKTTLQDWILFHKIEYDIIEGYYYNEGRNNKINSVIKDIYDERKKYKKLKNPLEAVLKLIMNSGYGKSILKPIDTDQKLIPMNEYEITEYNINNDKQHNTIKFKHFNKIETTINYLNKKSKYIKFDIDDNKKIKIGTFKKEGKFNFTYEKSYRKHINRNFNYIKECETCIDDRYMRIKTIKPIDEHFNSAHIGVEILSMSKRIMFEVMTTAEDNDLYMTYTDTDSIHIKYDDIPILEQKFKEKYNKEIKGNDLGQFHIDFEMSDKNIDTDTIYSDESLFLMKKCYIDKLKGFNKETKKYETDYHIRMKGIPESSILLKAYTDYDNDPIKLFEDLYKGNPIEFDLTRGYEKGNIINKMKLENKNFDIHTKKDFNRKITIRYNEYDKLEYN